MCLFILLLFFLPSAFLVFFVLLFLLSAFFPSAFFYQHFPIRIRHPQVSGPRLTDTRQDEGGEGVCLEVKIFRIVFFKLTSLFKVLLNAVIK